MIHLFISILQPIQSTCICRFCVFWHTSNISVCCYLVFPSAILRLYTKIYLVKSVFAMYNIDIEGTTNAAHLETGGAAFPFISLRLDKLVFPTQKTITTVRYLPVSICCMSFLLWQVHLCLLCSFLRHPCVHTGVAFFCFFDVVTCRAAAKRCFDRCTRKYNQPFHAST